jgi:hypothetical protein
MSTSENQLRPFFPPPTKKFKPKKTSGTKLSRRKRKADQILPDDGDGIDVQELSTRFHTMAERERKRVVKK